MQKPQNGIPYAGATKIPVARRVLDVFPNTVNVGHGHVIKTPISSKNNSGPIIGRTPIKKNNSINVFCSTQIIQYNFTTVQPVAKAIPIPTRSYPYIFQGSVSYQPSVSIEESKMPNVPLVHQKMLYNTVERTLKPRSDSLSPRFKQAFKLSSKDCQHKGQKDEVQPSVRKMCESRLEGHRDMFKKGFTKRKDHYALRDARLKHVLRGVRLNRRFDLQMQFRRDIASNVESSER